MDNSNVVVEMYNGNGQLYQRPLPKITWITDGEINDVALAHITKQTGLIFVPDAWKNYSAQPVNYEQIVKLFLTYNFKTRYYDNWNNKNTLMLKSDHHHGFDVNSICSECCKENHIHVPGLKSHERLSC